MASKVIKTTPNVLPGAMATFALDTDLVAPYKYHWKKDGAYIPGAPSAKTYTTPPMSSADFRSLFSCVIFGQNGVEETVGVAINPDMADPQTFTQRTPSVTKEKT